MSDIHRLTGHQPAWGVPHVRIDGEAKVTGNACYASDEPVQDVVHAFLLISSIARGACGEFMYEDAFAVDGVLDVLTHENVGSEAKPPAAGGRRHDDHARKRPGFARRADHRRDRRDEL
jgi:xanthine dehydrogenase YagR molybdenum-binding subunit